MALTTPTVIAQFGDGHLDKVHGSCYSPSDGFSRSRETTLLLATIEALWEGWRVGVIDR
jgi:hypothetical protein